MNPDEAVSTYIGKIKEMWDAQAKGGEQFIPDVAAELGLPEHVVQAAVNPRLSDYAGMLKSEPGQIMDGLRNDFLAMNEEDAGIVKTVLTQVLDSGQHYSPSDTAEILSQLLPRTSQSEIETMLVDNNVDMNQLAKWILEGDKTESVRAILGTRTAAGNQQLGRLAGDLGGLKARLSDATGQTKAATASLQKALDQGGQADAAAASRGVTAECRAQWLADKRDTAQGKIPAETEVVAKGDNTWRQFEQGNGTMLSRGERDRIFQGMARQRAAESARQLDNVNRAYDRAQWKVGNVPEELGRTFQERLMTNVNSPAIDRARRAVTSNVATLGEVRGWTEPKPGRQSAPYRTGAIGALAAKYNSSNEVLDNIHSMMTRKAEDAGLDMSDRATWTHPAVTLQPTELAGALHLALADVGAKLEGHEATNLDDSMHAAQIDHNIVKMFANDAGVTRLAQPDIVNACRHRSGRLRARLTMRHGRVVRCGLGRGARRSRRRSPCMT